MRLYHSTLIIFILLIISACTPTPEPTQALIVGQIVVDGGQIDYSLTPGSTVQEAITDAGIILETLDHVEPSPSSVLSDGAEILITRIKEEFIVEEIEVPFDQRRLPTELLPEGV